MPNSSKPLVLAAPDPRSIDLIFTKANKSLFLERYKVLEVEPDAVNHLDKSVLAEVRYILGQPPLDRATLVAMKKLKCIFNVESNLLNNMPYDYLFEKGIHVVTTGAVFAEPVAEIGLALALNLLRDVVDADIAFQQGTERWGYDGNLSARVLSGSNVGIIGFGDLGQALATLLAGFRCDIRVFDPWLPPSMLKEQGVVPASLDEVLTTSSTLFVVAAVTAENQHFLNAKAFSKMPSGSSFILLSRADVVDFDDLIAAVASGHIKAASDVFPEEPLPLDHPVRKLKSFIRSAHRAGALTSAFKQMGDRVLEDMALIDRELPPLRCKRAERETVSRMRSKPVLQN